MAGKWRHSAEGEFAFPFYGTKSTWFRKTHCHREKYEKIIVKGRSVLKIQNWEGGIFRHFVTIFRTSTKFRSSRRIELFLLFFRISFYFNELFKNHVSFVPQQGNGNLPKALYCHFLAKNQRILWNKKFKLYYCPKL